jgi:hypothetical protein
MSTRWPLTRVAAAVAAAAMTLAAGAAEPGVEFLDIVPLHHPASVSGPKPKELSGLAWDDRRGELVAASDKGVVYRIALDIEHRRLHSATVRSVLRIEGRGRPNAESIAVDGDTLWLADENRHDLLQVDARGRVLRREPLPASLPVRGNSGIEALVLHPTHGKLVVPQRPPRGEQEGLHHVHAGDGRIFAFFADRRGDSSVKAAELLGEGRLLVLEKLSDGSRTRFQLRLVLLASCPEAKPCDPAAWPIALPRDAAELNLEGLACLYGDLCVLVNDNGHTPGTESRLVLVALPPR